jgi:site-specific recombinase XerD
MSLTNKRAEYDEMSVEEAVREFLTDCRLRRRSGETIAFYERRLTRFLAPWWEKPLAALTRDGIRSALTEYVERYSPATANGYIRCIKALLNWARREDYDAVDPHFLQKVKEPQRIMPHISEPEEIEALLAQPDAATLLGLRDRALLLVMLDTGIRLSEVVGLDVDDVRQDHLVVRGKGDKERRVALSDIAQKEMGRYVRARRRAGASHPCLFPSRQGSRIHRRTVGQLIARYAEAAGLGGLRISPHALRRTFATHFVRNGGDIVRLQMALGHTSIAMARHYAQVVDADAFEQVRQYSPVAALSHRAAA